MPKKIALLVLLLLIAFFVVSNFLLLDKMFHPIGKDWHAHLCNAIRIIKDFDLDNFFKDPISVYNNVIMWDKDYPPLYYIIAALLKHFFGITFMFMTSSLFLLVLNFFTYKTGELLGGWENGLLSASILIFYPMVYLSSRDFNLELAQAAMVCASLYALLRSEGFQHRKYSFLFGLFFAAGLLVKQQTFLFVIGPLLVSLIGLAFNLKERKNALINVIAVFFIVAFSGYVFFYHIYDSNPEQIKHFFLRTTNTGALRVDSVHWFNLNHILFYFKSLKSYQIGIVNLVLFLGACFVYFTKKEYGKNRFFIASWVIFPLLLLNLIPIKYHEYTLSYLSALAIVTSIGILHFRSLALRMALIIFIFIFNSYLFIDLLPVEKYRQAFGNILDGNLIKEIRVGYTESSTYPSYKSSILKTLNPDYKAIKFLSDYFKNKKPKIGLLGYVAMPDSFPENELEFLFPLYAGYGIENLIFDPQDYEPDSLDAIVFVSDRDRPQEQWLNKDYYIKRLQDYQNYQSQEIKNKKIKPLDVDFALTFYLLIDELPAVKPKPNNRLVLRGKLDKAINCLPGFNLMNKIDGAEHRGDIFIYGRAK